MSAPAETAPVKSFYAKKFKKRTKGQPGKIHHTCIPTNRVRERKHRSGLSARQWRKYAQLVGRDRRPISRKEQRAKESAAKVAA